MYEVTTWKNLIMRGIWLIYINWLIDERPVTRVQCVDSIKSSSRVSTYIKVDFSID